MSWESVFTSVVAGGVGGQIIALFWGNRLTKKREFNKWLEQERYKLFVTLISKASHTPQNQVSLNDWTYQIRDASQQIHLLFENGTAPSELSNSMEVVFRLAQEKKDSSSTLTFDACTWTNHMREAVSEMRKQMSSRIKED
jgi:hypothetical protein